MSAQSKKNSNLPTGKNVDEYPGYEAWIGDRWAWEFLRRNVDFQSDCQTLERISTKNERMSLEKNLAARYGLRVWRSYRTAFDDQPPVEFFLGKARIYSVLNPGIALRVAPLKVGEIAVIIDLNDALENKHFLNQKIEHASAEIRLRFEAWAKTRPKKELRARLQAPDLLNLLRLLDLEESLAANATDVPIEEKIARTLKGDEFRNKTWSLTFKKEHIRAHEFADRDYIALLGHETPKNRKTRSKKIKKTSRLESQKS